MKTYTVINYSDSNIEVESRFTTESRTEAKRKARETKYSAIYSGGDEIARIIRGWYYPSYVRLSVRDYDFLAGEYWRDSGTMRAEKYYR